MRSIAATVALCLALVAMVLGLFVYSVLRTPVLNEAQLRDLGVIILPTPREIAPFELNATNGQPFGVADLQGHWTFVFFGFTNCPDICPTTMAELAKAERELRQTDPESAEQFRVVMVTVDPERDDVATLAAYVGAFSPQFVGAAGAVAATVELARQLNVGIAKVPSADGYTVDHGGQIVIVNPKGHYHGFIKLPHQADTIVQAFASLRANF